MTSPSNPNLSANLPPQGPARIVFLKANRAPTSADTKYRDGSFYLPNSEWTDRSSNPWTIWKLAQIKSSTNAVWQVFGTTINRPAYVKETSAYNIKISDNIIGVDTTSAPFTLTLPDPTTITNAQRWTIKDEGGQCAGNNLTVNSAGAGTIDGLSSVLLSVNYDSLDIYFNGTNYFRA